MVKKLDKHERDLLVIGNGFDLSLGLHSSFSQYIKINDKVCMDINSYFMKKDLEFMPGKLDNIDKQHKCEESFNKKCPIFYNIVKFNRMLIKDQRYLIAKITRVIRSFPISLKRVNEEIHISPDDIKFRKYTLTPRQIAYDYFNMKLCSNNNCELNINSFNISRLNMVHTHELIRYLNRLNKWGNKRTRELINQAIKIRDSFNNEHITFNFWKLLILFSKFLDVKMNYLRKWNVNHTIRSKNRQTHNTWYNKLHFNNWYDVENIIKEFIISIYNFPSSNNNNKNLWKYIPDDNLFLKISFNIFTYINRYLDLLGHLIQGGPLHFAKPTDSYYSMPHKGYNFYSLYRYIFRTTNIYYRKVLNCLFNYRKINDNFDIAHSLIFILLVLGYDASYYNIDEEHEHLFNKLRSDVYNFEQDFGNYLTKQLDAMYIGKSSKLLDRLAISSDLKSLTKNYSVLDFNYTPLNKNITHIKHVHGTLEDKNEIIGVGEQEIDKLKHRLPDYISNSFYRELYSFTKTYRLFSLKHKYDPRFLYNIKNIVFFGHSLGTNDYPYFEALFDHFHLYSNPNINLIFCYSGHSKENSEYIKRNLVPKIVHLLRNYSDSIKQSHSENLIAKMFVEDRIKLYDMTYN